MERRHFTRIIFSAPVELRQQGSVWETELLDLSLNGALIKRPPGFIGDSEAAVMVAIRLAGLPSTILLQGKLVHQNSSELGISCDLMDIDSATRLRRLVEVNVGDDALLHRDIQSLSAKP